MVAEVGWGMSITVLWTSGHARAQDGQWHTVLQGCFRMQYHAVCVVWG